MNEKNIKTPEFEKAVKEEIDNRYPIHPLMSDVSADERMNDDALLDDFRLSIMSISLRGGFENGAVFGAEWQRKKDEEEIQQRIINAYQRGLAEGKNRKETQC